MILIPQTYSQTAEGDQPYAIVLYDYVSDVEGDLNLQTGDLVYLIKRVDDSWLYGMCGGVEGMFPTGYVNIVVPLAEEQDVEVPQAISSENHDNVNTTDYKQQSATALYQFVAETENDLSLEVMLESVYRTMVMTSEVMFVRLWLSAR